MDAIERGAARYRFHETRVWTADSETRFVRKVLTAFPDAVEVDRDGNPVPLEQLSLEG